MVSYAPTNSSSFYLCSILQKPIMNSTKEWKTGAEEIKSLADCLEAYRKFLIQQNQTIKHNHSLLHPVKTIAKDATLEHRKATPFLQDKYSLINASVKEAGEGKPVIFDETIHISRPFESNLQRFRFIESLQLSVPIDIIRFSPGGSIISILCISQVPENRTEAHILVDGARLIQDIRPRLLEFHTRAQKQAFKEKLRNIVNLSGSVVEFIYKELALDASVAAHPVTHERLRLISLGDTGFIADLRHLNPGRPSTKYDVFFEKLAGIIEERTASDDRRHGTAHLSEYLSLRDLIEKTTEQCPKDTPVPSKSLVRLQFTPRNPYSHAALNFTSRINVQFKIQRRQLRLSHEDIHFCNAQYKYLKERAVELKGSCLFLCSDDKAKVPFGDPGCAVSTGVRGKKSIVDVDTTLVAMDHDMSKGSLTPSVILSSEIPNTPDKSFVRGKVFTTINDSVFQMASPFRHATLMAKVMESEKYPVLLKMTDGGTDQRNTLQSVRCANITLFKEFDLDMLIHVRCAPGQSWINPAERIMSILNIGLQNVSLEREELIDKTKEAAVRRCGSMAEIRELGSKVKEGWTVAVEPLQRIIKNRFCRLKLKDEAITVYDPVTDEQIDLMKRHLRELFPELKLDKLQKVHTDKVQSYKGWIEKHCKISHYSFQIRKCTDEKCCLPTVLPREKLSWLPDPVLDDSKEHFKKYCDVNGTETTDSDRPSLKVAKKKTEKQPKAKPISEEVIDKESSVVEEQETVKEDYTKLPDSDPQLCTTQRSRSLVTCVECRKPRIVYAKNKLTERQTMAFVTAVSMYEYTCGSVLLPPGHALYNSVQVRNDLACCVPIELQYYTSGLGITSMCCYCSSEDGTVNPDLKKKYKTVLPVCQECLDAEKQPVVQRPYGKQCD